MLATTLSRSSRVGLYSWVAMSAFECTCSTCMQRITLSQASSTWWLLCITYFGGQRQPNATTHSAFDCSCATSGSTSENSQLRPQTAKVQHPSIISIVHQYPQSSQSEFSEINLNYRLSWLELDPVDIVESSEYLSFHLIFMNLWI